MSKKTESFMMFLILTAMLIICVAVITHSLRPEKTYALNTTPQEVELSVGDNTALMSNNVVDKGANELAEEEDPENWAWLIVVATVLVGVLGTILILWKKGMLTTTKKQNRVKALEIKSFPRKLTYRVGEKLDLRGVRLNLVYEDDTREEVTDYKFGTIIVTKDTNLVEFSYKQYGVSVTQEIFVI